MKADRTQLAKEVRARIGLSGFVGESVALKRDGKEFVGLCPFHAEKTPSFTVNDAKGFFHCFGCGANGDAIGYAMKRYAMPFGDAVEYLAGRLGLVQPEAGYARPKPLVAAVKVGAAPEPDKSAAVMNVWGAAKWGEQLIDFYFAGRGIDVARLGGVPKSVRMATLYHAESRCELPCMVSAIQGVDRQIMGVHRTWLEVLPASALPEVAARTKAVLGVDVAKVVVKVRRGTAKKMLGKAAGGAVRLCAAEKRLAIAEGIETALSVRLATGMACWAALSLGNLATIRVPDEVTELVLCADNDAKDPRAAEEQLRKAVAAHRKKGRKVWVAKPPVGFDFNDLLQRGVHAD